MCYDLVMDWLAEQLARLLVGKLAGNPMGTVATLRAQWAKRRSFRRNLPPDVENAYLLLRNVCEPDTLNPVKPGNPAAMKSMARDAANLLSKRLCKAGFDPPATCGIDDASLQLWFKFLERVRIVIA